MMSTVTISGNTLFESSTDQTSESEFTNIRLTADFVTFDLRQFEEGGVITSFLSSVIFEGELL